MLGICLTFLGFSCFLKVFLLLKGIPLDFGFFQLLKGIPFKIQKRIQFLRVYPLKVEKRPTSNGIPFKSGKKPKSNGIPLKSNYYLLVYPIGIKGSIRLDYYSVRFSEALIGSSLFCSVLLLFGPAAEPQQNLGPQSGCHQAQM